MKVGIALAVVLGSSVAHAGGHPAVVQILRHTDAGRLQLGAGGTLGTAPTLDLLVGYHVTDRVLVRARQRLWPAASELELGYALGVGKLLVPTEAIVRFKLFALAGGGITSGGAPTAHAGFALDTHVQPWLSLQLGARALYVPTDAAWVARSTAPLPETRALAAEVFASLSFMFPGPGYECVIR